MKIRRVLYNLKQQNYKNIRIKRYDVEQNRTVEPTFLLNA